jgi:hypothetical protein
MKKHLLHSAGIILLVVTGFFIFSCNSTDPDYVKRKDIAGSFVTAHRAFVATNPAQDSFFTMFTTTVDNLKENRTAAIDTKELERLLPLAKEANAKRKQLVNETVAEDSTILYHNKANELINRVDSFYQKFPALIQLLQTTNEDRYDEYLKLMTDPLMRMRRAQEKYQEASDSMTRKYDIKISK